MRFVVLLLMMTSIAYGQLSGSNLPIIHLTVSGEIPDEPPTPGSMGIIYDSLGGLNSSTDVANVYNGQITIETRGQSSQGFDKKSYTIRLTNLDGSPNPTSLLGMPAHDKWVLHALHIDKTLMRIPMSFYFSDRMGNYTTRYRYVEVLLNGEYRGLYCLIEKIEQGPDRVDIDTLSNGDSGYILRIDWDSGGGGFGSNYESLGGVQMQFQYQYPKGSEMQTSHKDFIRSYMDRFEDAVFANDFTNSQGERYTDLSEISSFADFLLINELTKNSDGYKLSTYMHKDTEANAGRLKAGPIWDFDQTYGLSTVCSSNDTCGWTYLQNQPDCGDINTMPKWWENLTRDSTFCNLLVQRWQNYRSGFLHTDSVFSWIDQNLLHIGDAKDRNFVQWPILDQNIWIEPEGAPTTYSGHIEHLKIWIDHRLRWVDRNIASIYDFTSQKGGVKVYPNPSAGVTNIAIRSGGNVKIADVTGRLVWSGYGCNDTNFEIDVSNWDIGTYIVYVKTIRGVYSGKLVVR